MNLEYNNIGELLEKNNLIFNYIYDKYGFRCGIVIAQKNSDRPHPKMAWALFDESEHRYIAHNKLGEIPLYHITDDDMYDLPCPTVYETILTSKESRIKLFELALSRLNFNSYDFYIDFRRSSGQDKSNFRCDSPRLYIKFGVTDVCDSCRFDPVEEQNNGLVQAIKDQVRRTELRAFRYFK